MQATQAFDEKTMLEDLLNSQKQRMDAYCTLLWESSCPQQRMMLSDLLIEAAEDQFAIFELLRQKGWYPGKEASEQELQQAKQKAQQLKGSM